MRATTDRINELAGIIDAVARHLGELLRCECPDYHYRKDPAGSYICKHILAAIKKIEEEEIEEE